MDVARSSIRGSIMKTIILAALGAASIAFASAPAAAKQYVDYTPQKGYWDVNAVEVDPNHIDDYKFMVRSGYVKGSPNVLLMTHSKSYGVLDADQARDQAIDKEIEAMFTKEQNDAAIAGYEKYRTFIDNAQWTDIKMGK
jgi:hypothetical protein